MSSTDRDYYRQRIEQEAAAADASSCDYTRAIHIDLGQRYAEKLRTMEMQADPAHRLEPRRIS